MVPDLLTKNGIYNAYHLNKKKWISIVLNDTLNNDYIMLLNNGINVYTTVNVQHLEGVNDLIDAKTNVDVSERIPDELFDLADENQMAIMVRFAEDQMTISSAEGGGTDQVLATSLSHYNYGKDNRIDFAFTRVKHCVTLKIYVNDVRVYFNDVAMSKHVNSALDNGNFTFMAGRYEDDENKGDGETGYRNYGDRLGVYADDETTLVLKDYE